MPVRASILILAAYGFCLIVDCHSFPSHALPVDINQTTPRPDICIGTDVFHTPPAMVEALKERCAALSWSLGVDFPYSGTLVPLKHYRQEPRVRSVMIEVNRRLYLADEARDIRRTDAFNDVKNGVRALIDCVSSQMCTDTNIPELFNTTAKQETVI